MSKSLTTTAVFFLMCLNLGCNGNWRDESLRSLSDAAPAPDATEPDIGFGGSGGEGGQLEPDAAPTPDASLEPDMGAGGSPDPDAALPPDAGPQPECIAGADCQDDDPCTRDACLDGTCTHEHTDVRCNDADDATQDVCVFDSTVVDRHTCLNIPIVQPADCEPTADFNACTQDLCDADGNTIHPPKDCGDGDPSTVDTCLGILGECQHESICGDGTAYDPAQGQCVPFIEETCVEDAFSCQQFASVVGYAQCHANRWLLVNECGPLEIGVCVDGRGCSNPQ